MFNPFPELLTYGFFAPLFLRAALGIAIISFGVWSLGKDKINILAKYSKYGRIVNFFPWKLSILSFLCGIALIFGAQTQIASLVAIGLLLAFGTIGTISRGMASILIIIAFSLLLTGAGAPAFDLPL